MNYLDYLDLEKKITAGVDALFEREIDPNIHEMLRQETLRQRVFARDLWVAMKEKVPSHLRFEEPKNV